MLAIEWFGIHWYPSGPFTVQTQCLACLNKPATGLVKFLAIFSKQQDRAFDISAPLHRGCGENVSYTTALRAGRTEEARKYLEINCEVKRQIYVRSRQMSAKPNSKLFGAILIELRVCCVQG
jgi:hypothetical protein